MTSSRSVAASIPTRPCSVHGEKFWKMVPLSQPADASLEDSTVLICGGRFDPIATRQQVSALAELLRDRKAEVEVRIQESGHELTETDVETARDWLAASAIA